MSTILRFQRQSFSVLLFLYSRFQESGHETSLKENKSKGLKKKKTIRSPLPYTFLSQSVVQSASINHFSWARIHTVDGNVTFFF